MERKLWVLGSFIVAAALLLTSTGIFVYLTNRANCNEFENTCLSSECIQAASIILSHLDTKTNPCKDFFQFTCGKFADPTTIPENKNYVSTSSNTFIELQRQLRELLDEPLNKGDKKHTIIAKNYYKACNNIVAIEHLGSESLEKILHKIGGWPVLKSTNWDENEFASWKSLSILNEIGIDTNFLFKISIISNTEVPNSRIIHLDLPTLSLPLKFLRKHTNNEYVRIYFHFMVGIAKKMGAKENKAVAELHHSLDFEINLAHLSLANKNLTKIFISELVERYPNIPWLEFINNITAPHAVVTKRDMVSVESLDYIKHLNVLLKKTPKRIQANYIAWRAIESLIPYLSEEFRERGYAFESAVTDNIEIRSRWQECIQEINRRLPFILSRLYINQYFDDESQKLTENIYESIKKEFFKHANNFKLFNNSFKVKSEFESFSKLLAYPKELPDDSLLENIYGKLEIDSEDYLQSYFNIQLLHNELLFRSLREAPLLDNWDEIRIVTGMNKDYDSSMKRITVSAGALQGLFFNKNYPQYLNYAGLGFTLARQFVHIFLEQFSNNSLVFNEQIFDCFLNSYNNKKLNTSIALNELISYKVGLKIAYSAYKSFEESEGNQDTLPALKRTTSQLFWTSFSINECSIEDANYLQWIIAESGFIPTNLKINGALSMSDEFGNDFLCPPGFITDLRKDC